MSQAWVVVGTVLLSLLVVWVVLVALLLVVARRQQREVDLAAAVRLVPDVLRLLKRLVGDRTLSRGVRWWPALGLAYLLLPVDLVPDVVPVLGLLDDVVVVVLVLRAVVGRAGEDAVRRHWPGTPDGLATVLAATRRGDARNRPR